MSTPQGAFKAKQELRWILPNHFRQLMELPFGKIEVYYDGKEGWFSGPQGMMAVPPPVAKQVQGGMFRETFSLLLSDRDPERTIAAVGDNAIEISDKSGNSVRLDLDSATGRALKSTYRSVAMTGEPATVTETYSDFKEVAGVMLPHKSTIEQNGQKFGEVTIVDRKINTGLKVEDLAKKP
jgi:hypothetical protein